MLPRNDEVALRHATMNDPDATILEKFRADNPHLVPVEWDGRTSMCLGMWHISFINHRHNAGSNEIHCCSDTEIESCLTDHKELWQDLTTEDLVHIAHPYCKGEDAGFREGSRLITGKRGLNIAMSEASWYFPGQANLVVVARPRTLERVNFGDSLILMDDRNSEWDAKKVAAMQQAWEDVESDRWFAEARKCESDEDFHMATLMFVDTAHTERTGRFHRRATQALREAGRMLCEHYEDAIETVATRSFLNNADTRKVFEFAGTKTPDWLERIWRNAQRQESLKWGYRFVDDPTNREDWKELYRCTVCEEWMEPGERIHAMRIGMVHKDKDCFKEAAGLAPATSR